MNNKGVVFLVYFMIGVIFFWLGMAIAPSLTQTADETRDQLDCSNESISNQDKAVCYQVDAIPPFYIGIILGFAGIILARIVT